MWQVPGASAAGLRATPMSQKLRGRDVDAKVVVRVRSLSPRGGWRWRSLGASRLAAAARSTGACGPSWRRGGGRGLGMRPGGGMRRPTSLRRGVLTGVALSSSSLLPSFRPCSSRPRSSAQWWACAPRLCMTSPSWPQGALWDRSAHAGEVEGVSLPRAWVKPCARARGVERRRRGRPRQSPRTASCAAAGRREAAVGLARGAGRQQTRACHHVAGGRRRVAAVSLLAARRRHAGWRRSSTTCGFIRRRRGWTWTAEFLLRSCA